MRVHAFWPPRRSRPNAFGVATRSILRFMPSLLRRRAEQLIEPAAGAGDELDEHFFVASAARGHSVQRRCRPSRSNRKLRMSVCGVSMNRQ